MKSALDRPLQTFDKKDLYPTIREKAAALLESIIKNHPFLDGNKRTGYTLCRLILNENDIDIMASDNEKYDFIIQIAKNKLITRRYYPGLIIRPHEISATTLN